MRNILKILFSKAVILTYLFIGYVAITDKDTPVNFSDSVPCFSVNPISYPSATIIQITTTEHLRSAKKSVDRCAFVSMDMPDFSPSLILFSSFYDPSVATPHQNITKLHQGRAPPSI